MLLLAECQTVCFRDRWYHIPKFQTSSRPLYKVREIIIRAKYEYTHFCYTFDPTKEKSYN